MPFVLAKFSTPVSPAQEIALKNGFGQAIGLIPYKSESVLLLEIEQDAHLWLAGDNHPSAYIQVSIFANEHHSGYAEFTAEITRLIHKTLSIAPERIFIKFDDITAWGMAGQYIERRG
ncbi:macrophage migration inhibitory factor (MIF) [Bibersteinia trehalosi]|uniref:phenylpyruvate tautomerase MIF-related protein n=1 Tax=Bibersteinia trehalosi TaxID=47735 RepID=UPI00104C3359|nr:phenylpyruvate tautomerase MIF-related protein [Bibersteinia trehalosi]TCT16473.1 macrophage migration inhibitory factor (MIF) [Bibersteinia trehalosi]